MPGDENTYFPTTKNWKSIDFGPFDSPPVDSLTLPFRELVFQVEELNIQDSAFIPNPRKVDIINFASYREVLEPKLNLPFGDTPERDILKLYGVMMGRAGKVYERERNSVIDLVSNLGGLAAVLLDFLAPIIIVWLIKPFDDLNMALKFSKMRVLDGLACVKE